MWHRYLGYADAAYATLVNNWYNYDDGSWDGMRFWQAANAMHAIADFAALRPVGGVEDMFATMFQRNKDTNFAYDSNDFDAEQDVFDDEGWWALAWLAAYDLLTSPGVVDAWGLANAYLQMAKTIFNNMSSQWTWRCNGGLCWETPDHAGGEALRYKNAIVNELFLTLAIRLYQRTRDALYLDWARSELNWFQKSGMQNSAGLINDGLVPGSCVNNGKPTYTYNQGVILGGLADLYLATGDYGSYIERGAWRIFQAVTTSPLVSDGVLTEPVGPDDESPQFRGPFMRYLSYLCSIDPDPDRTHRPAYLTFIARNANSLWLNSRNDTFFGTFFGYSWAGPFQPGPFDRPNPLFQSAAFDALIAAIRLDSL
ncbi:MAG: glycoside hydrolase family 76 protein [Chthoniobacterales bacterium]